MASLSPEKAKEISQAYFEECLKRMDQQILTADVFSEKMVKLVKSEPRLNLLLTDCDLTVDIHRIDFFLPNNFQYKNPSDPTEVTGMHLGYHNYFNGDKSAILNYVKEKHGLEIEEYTVSYKALDHAISRAIKELKRIHELKRNLESDIKIEDEWFFEQDTEEKIKAALKALPRGKRQNISELHEAIEAVFFDLFDDKGVAPSAQEVWRSLKKQQYKFSCILEFTQDSNQDDIIQWENDVGKICNPMKRRTFANVVSQYRTGKKRRSLE